MFYVIDTSDISLSWDSKNERGEQFGSRKSAEKRAKELADSEPGRVFEIVETVGEASCAVAPPVVTRRE